MRRLSVPVLAILALVSGVALAGCGASSGGSSKSVPSATPTAAPTTSSAGVASGSGGAVPPSTPTHLSLNAQGIPNLKGIHISIGLGAGAPHVGDTTAYLVQANLKKWGANVNFTFSDNRPLLAAAVSGRLDAVITGMVPLANAGLTLFGPNQARIDYLLIGNGITKVSQLKGKSVGSALPTSEDTLLLTGILKTAGLTRADVHSVYTNSSSNTLNAMVTKRLDAGFIHADGWLKLQTVPGLHILAVGSKVEPWVADSFVGAQSSWLKANPAIAEAYDLAWLNAAKTFDTDPAGWVKAAGVYTHNVDTPATVTAIQSALAKADPWPDTASAYTSSIVKKNYTNDQALKLFTARGNRPLSQIAAYSPWGAAAKAFTQSNKG